MAKARPAALKGVVLSSLFGLVVSSTPLLIAQQKSADEWEVLKGCRLITNAVVDGDSFHVRHDEREYIFRLYFVDTPECDPSLKQRVQDQAAYFGISTADIPRAGEVAAQFTRETLSSADFTIITRWQNGMGRSRLARFEAIVLIKGRNLAEELVSKGLGRIHGLRANWPDGPRSTMFLNQLKNLELTAREKKLGIWDETKFLRQTNSVAVSATRTNVPGLTLVDINIATFEELQTLPTIGPKLAERIMAYRPYQKVDDLDKVPGIGPVTLKRLQPLIRAETTPP